MQRLGVLYQPNFSEHDICGVVHRAGRRDNHLHRRDRPGVLHVRAHRGGRLRHRGSGGSHRRCGVLTRAIRHALLHVVQVDPDPGRLVSVLLILLHVVL